MSYDQPGSATPRARYDVIGIGVGGMGSAVGCHLAGRDKGRRVCKQRRTLDGQMCFRHKMPVAP